MKSIKIKNSIKGLFTLLIAAAFTVYFIACSDSSVTSDATTDDGYIQQVINSGYGTSQQEEDDVMSGEVGDLDDGGPVSDNGGDTPIDSLYKWGRKIISVNVNVN